MGGGNTERMLHKWWKVANKHINHKSEDGQNKVEYFGPLNCLIMFWKPQSYHILSLCFIQEDYLDILEIQCKHIFSVNLDVELHLQETLPVYTSHYASVLQRCIGRQSWMKSLLPVNLQGHAALFCRLSPRETGRVRRGETKWRAESVRLHSWSLHPVHSSYTTSD